MPRRMIKLDVKVAAMRESLRLVDAADIANKYQLSKQSMYDWYHKVLEVLPAVLANDKPGPKPKLEAELSPLFRVMILRQAQDRLWASR